MTVRELREILFYIENQEITVKELRAGLFEVEEQDEEHEAFEMSKLINKSLKKV